MYEVPRIPQTRPCDDEDPFFVFHEDNSADDNSIGVEIGVSSTPEAPSYSVRKERENSTRSSRSYTVRQNTKNKRRLYRNKTFSRSNFSNKIKTAIQSPSRNTAQPDNKSGWQRSNMKDKSRLYDFLEDEESSPPVPDDFDDDKSSTYSFISLPSRFATSMSWKKRPYAGSSCSSSTISLVTKHSKLKWKKLIQMDSLSTFKASPGLSPPSIPKTLTGRTMELASSTSTESLASSCNSSLKSAEDKAKRFISPRLESRLKKGLYNARVDEDSDSEDDEHPEAGSFAFAIRRRAS